MTITPADAVTALARLHFPDTFNPYADLCPEHDRPNAVDIRRKNLLATFEKAVGGVEAIWIALEPGHRGARRTGLAMTDDSHLAAHARRWQLTGIERATASGPETEQTAGIVWEALARNKTKVLLWNVFPLHCHKPGEPLSNRRHTRAERDTCWDLTCAIIAMVKPKHVVAIGNDAHAAVKSLGHRCVMVRHPAYGGKADFLAGVAR